MWLRRGRLLPCASRTVLTVFGALAATTMVVSYALEHRHRRWIAVFAAGCVSVSIFGVLTGAWVFAVLEAIWAAIAIRRFQQYEECT